MSERIQTISVSMSQKLARRSRILAAMQGKSRSAFIAEAVERAIRDLERKATDQGQHTQGQEVYRE